MRQLRFSSQFKRDMKRVKRSRGGNMDEIDHVVDLLLTDTPLPARCHDHPHCLSNPVHCNQPIIRENPS